MLGSEGVWFRHPLLADVLTETYLPGEATPVHAAWAAHLETVSTEGIDELRRLGDLASHHERAGDSSAAFAALLQGADLAEKLGARREAADLLTRAADLSEVGAEDVTDVVSRARLLERAGGACLRVERERDSYRLLGAASNLVSPQRHPLWASRLSARLAALAFDLGETQESPLSASEQAVELSRVEPDSREHAKALASYANNLRWEGRTEEARRVLEDAVAAAHRSGSAATISRAHGLRAQFMMDTDLEQAALDSTVCWEQALDSDDPYVIGYAYATRWLISYGGGDLRRCHQVARDMYQWSVREGTTVYSSLLLTDALLAMGALGEAEAIVRTGLASTGRADDEAEIRLWAGVLAARRGANEAAGGHLARAHEIRPYLEEPPYSSAGAATAEVLLSRNDPAGAFQLVERALPGKTIPRMLDELMVLGARATAELVQQASDDRDQAAVRTHREALTRLVETRAALPGIAFRPSGPDDTVQVARAALFAAEVGRAEGVEDQLSPWREAVAACAEAGLGWEQQVSTWRLASALVQSGGCGTDAAELLRGVHDYAVQQSATPLQTRVEELAAGARISLTSPMIPTAATVPAAFTGLTAREKEVLVYLVANRTNAEIAAGALHQREDGERARLQPAAQDRDGVTPRGRRAGPSHGLGSRRMTIRERSSVSCLRG